MTKQSKDTIERIYTGPHATVAALVAADHAVVALIRVRVEGDVGPDVDLATVLLLDVGDRQGVVARGSRVHLDGFAKQLDCVIFEVDLTSCSLHGCLRDQTRDIRSDDIHLEDHILAGYMAGDVVDTKAVSALLQLNDVVPILPGF